MNIYIILLLLAFVFAFYEMVTKDVPRLAYLNKVWLIVMFILLFCVAGFRTVGFDYVSYEYYYRSILSENGNWLTNGLDVGSEPGYSLLNYIAGSYRSLVAIISFIGLTLLFIFLYKYSPLPLFSIAIYISTSFLPGLMGQQRQAIAIIISLFALINIHDRRKFFAYLFCAALFHISALLVLFALFIPKEFKSVSIYIRAFVIALVFSAIAGEWYQSLIGQMTGFIGDKLAIYAKTEKTVLGLNTAVLLRVLIFVVIYVYRNSLPKLKQIPFLANCYFISLLIYVALGFAPQLAGRGSNYFAILEIFLCASLLRGLKVSNKLFFFIAFMALAFIRLIPFILADMGGENNINYLPYKNWLF